MTMIPTGSVTAFSGTVDKLARMTQMGWLKCDGSSVSRHTYPELYSVIGTIYGGGGDNFSLPDMRGYFLRGVDDGSRRDPDAASRCRQGGSGIVGGSVGSWQGDQFGRHHHNWDHFFHDISWSGGDIAVHQPPDSQNLQNNRDQATNQDGGGAETRPKNVYVYFLINSGIRQLIGLTQMNDGALLGIGPDQLLCTRKDATSSWVNIPDSGSVIGVTQLRDGTIVGIGTDYSLYTRANLTSNWSKVQNSGSVIAITQLSDGKILGVGTNNNLCTRDTLTSPWVGVANSGAVIAIAQLLDGRILGVGTDHNLYTRDSLTSPWTSIANSGSVTAIAQLKSGLIFGIGMDGTIWERGAPNSSWVRSW